MRTRFPLWVWCAFMTVACVAPAQAVSPRGAFFRSLLLPGWGQLAIDAPKRAAVFAAAEGALLAGAAGTAIMGNIYRDDYRALAAAVAGANLAGKGDGYFSDLAFYETRAHHNQAALIYDQPDPTLYAPEDDWQWPSTDDRMTYRRYWNRSRAMGQRLDYVLFAVSLNHLASAVDAAKQASRRNPGTSAWQNVVPRVGTAAASGRVDLRCAWSF